MLATFRQDVRYALRSFQKSPAFTAVALVILTLGIGATTAIFSVVDAVLIKSLPYEDPERLVRLRHVHDERGLDDGGGFSPQDFADLEEGTKSYEHLAAYHFVPGLSTATLFGDGMPERVAVAAASEHFFAVLGRPAALGRTIEPADVVPGKDAVVVLSHGFFERRFAADPGVIGRSLHLNGAVLEVVGVMPPSFRFPSREVEAWVPLSRITEDMIPRRREVRFLQALAKTAPEVDLETAAAEVRTVLARLAEIYPETNQGWEKALVTPLRESMVGQVRPALLVLFGATALVLLTASANLAHLLLARGAGRGREMAVRMSLGASRGRILRQLLTESVLLALLGAVSGLALAVWGVRVLVAMSAGTLPLTETVGPDARLLGFALLSALVTGVIFGLLPALTAAGLRPASMLREGSASVSGGRRQTLRGLLVAGETALAVILVIGAGLLLKSFWKLVRVDPGFETERVLSFDLQAPTELFDSNDARRSAERLTAYQKEMIEAIERVPGVLAAGASKTSPLASGGEPMEIEIRTADGGVRVLRPESGLHIVTPGYFEALGIPVLQGETFTEATAPTAVVINRALAERYWPAGDAVGQELGTGRMRLTVLGVVANVHHEGVARPARSALYVQPMISPRIAMSFFVRTVGDPLASADAVRRAVGSVHPEQAISDLSRLRQAIEADVARPRFLTTLLTAFAGLALVLASLGIYGVVSYSVAQRTGELGVRMVLGARRRDLLYLVVSRAMAVCAAGLALGLLGAFSASRALAGLLYGVDARDPATFAGVAVLLLLVAFLASFVPALRAARLDPVTALRAE